MQYFKAAAVVLYYNITSACSSVSQLTIEGIVEEMSIYSAGGYTQVVGGHQGVVTIVVVCWVFKG